MATSEKRFDKVLSEKWDEVKAALRRRWGDKISDRDLDEVAHQHDAICHFIGEKCGMGERKAREEVNKVLDGLTVSHP